MMMWMAIAGFIAAVQGDDSKLEVVVQAEVPCPEGEHAEWHLYEDGLLYLWTAAGEDGNPTLAAYECTEGKRRWKYAYDGKYFRRPVSVRKNGDRIVLFDYRLVAILDAATGAVKMEQKSKPEAANEWSEVIPAVAFTNDLILLPVNKELIAFTREGARPWSHKPPKGEVLSEFTAIPNAVIVNTYDEKRGEHSMYALSPKGTKMWEYKPPTVTVRSGDSSSKRSLRPKAFSWSGLYLVGYSEFPYHLVFVRPDTGQVKKVYELPDEEDPSSMDFVPLDGPFVRTLDGTSYFLLTTAQSSTGRLYSRGKVWSHALESGKVREISRMPISYVAGWIDDHAILDDDDGTVRAVDIATGAPRWTCTGLRVDDSSSGKRIEDVMCLGSSVCFLSENTTMIVLDGKTGTVVRRIPLKTHVESKNLHPISDPPGFLVFEWPKILLVDVTTGTAAVSPEMKGGIPIEEQRWTFDAKTRRLIWVVRTGSGPQLKLWELHVSKP